MNNEINTSKLKNPIDWESINNNPASIYCYLTPRKRGKTDHKAQKFLKNIHNNKKGADGEPVLYCWIRRRWNDSRNCSRPLFETNVRKFCDKNAIKFTDWEIKSNGVYYEGIRRIYFIDLFSFQTERGAIAEVLFEELVFDEAIPIDQEFLRLGEKDEQWIFHDLLESLKRDVGNIKITFLANDYYWSAWWLDIFDENSGKLFAIKKEANELKEKANNSGITRIVTWKDLSKETDPQAKTDWLLYVNLIEGEYDAQSASLAEKINPNRRNWDDFMIPLVNKNENIKKYQIIHAIQDFYFCELGERAKKKKYFFMHWSKNEKELENNLVNYCWDLKEKANSRLKYCVIRDQKEYTNRWVNMLKENMLFFTDFRSRDWFIDQLR